MDKGLKILLDTYWTSKGWKSAEISTEDFSVAKEEGYMFDYPTPISHDMLLNQIKDTVDLIRPEDVTNAFLFSLSTRRLEYRSALGSFWYAVSIPQHTCIENKCYICA